MLAITPKMSGQSWSRTSDEEMMVNVLDIMVLPAKYSSPKTYLEPAADSCVVLFPLKAMHGAFLSLLLSMPVELFGVM
jgi:hypothetical protein